MSLKETEWEAVDRVYLVQDWGSTGVLLWTW